MASFPLLDVASEDALHKSRLFNTEEKPFRRITTRLFSESSILAARSRFPLTPPPDGNAGEAETSIVGAEDGSSTTEAKLAELARFREDVRLDFANFESSLVRMQLMLNSNEAERRRYAAEKLRIEATAGDVRRSAAELQGQLAEARRQLALRREYDTLAERITGNRLLKPREDQRANIDKLNGEIAELQRESREYAHTWTERRQQFGRIVDEGMQLRRLIRDEKEEVERREGMEGDDDHDHDDNAAAAGTARGARSNAGTPMPDAGGATPLHPGLGAGDPNSLNVDKPSSRSKSPFHLSTPNPEAGTPRASGEEDIRMQDDDERGAVDSDSSSEGLVAEDEDEEGEAKEDDSGDEGRVESMDTT